VVKYKALVKMSLRHSLSCQWVDELVSVVVKIASNVFLSVGFLPLINVSNTAFALAI
jgi:hypothetical protein